jgi:hypothetical protein
MPRNWVAQGGSLDRFGMAVAVPAVAKAGATGPMKRPRPASSVRHQRNSAEPPAVGVCLSPELRDILGRAHGQRIAVPACEAPCLPKPPAIDSEDAQSYERAHGFSWCRSCIPFAGNLGIDDITRIEKAGNLTLCPTPRRQAPSRAQEAQGLMIDRLRGTRTVFRRDVLPSETHGGFAVIVSLANYVNGLPQRARSERDAAGMHAVLVERLGFRSNRVIELRDPGRDELEGIFGRAGSAKGLLSERLKEAAGSQLFIYVSGLGAFADDDGAAYIMPAACPIASARAASLWRRSIAMPRRLVQARSRSSSKGSFPVIRAGPGAALCTIAGGSGAAASGHSRLDGADGG